jgi:hypothetical protein
LAASKPIAGAADVILGKYESGSGLSVRAKARRSRMPNPRLQIVSVRDRGTALYRAEVLAAADSALAPNVVVCEVHVFPLEVKRQQKRWPEKGKREVRWLSPTEAAKKVQEPILCYIIRSWQKGR